MVETPSRRQQTNYRSQGTEGFQTQVPPHAEVTLMMPRAQLAGTPDWTPSMCGGFKSCFCIFVLFGLGRGCLWLYFFFPRLVCFTHSTKLNSKNRVKEPRRVQLSLVTAHLLTAAYISTRPLDTRTRLQHKHLSVNLLRGTALELHIAREQIPRGLE